MRTILKIFMMCFCVISYAQTTINGSVTDQNSQPLTGANVIVDGTSTGAMTDFDGNYSITVNAEGSVTVTASMMGFKSSSQSADSSSTLNFSLEDGTFLDEVVVSASRTPQRIFESPVTIERFGVKEIANTASSDFYDGLENMKGVDINVNSLTFKAINTRGFATFANTRFVQLVDGMDNSAPALNFPLGNLLGMTETDVLSVELLPGASSALYGANAFNGILLMTSKSPFDHTGLSGQYKQGITSQEAAGDNTYRDLSLRFAHKFSDKFAIKANFGYLLGTDWVADSQEDKFGRGLTRADHDHDGINIYGDEVATDLNGVAQSMAGLGLIPAGAVALIPSQTVSRTGYREVDLTDHAAESKKADWGLYYRPFESNFEISYVGKWGTGQTVYQGTNRYGIENFTMSQHKLEVKDDNFFVRAYVTEDNAGDSYDMNFTAININRSWRDDTTWFGTYVGGFLGATLGGATEEMAHAIGRAGADQGRLLPGTPEFDAAFETVVNNPDLTTGAKFQDNSKVYHSDWNYSFADQIEFADIQVGGSFRQYSLNSSGTIYTDYDGPIDYSETGIYTQVVKNFMDDDRMTITAAARYDKNEFFDGQVTPRVSLSYTAGEYKNHNFRLGFQTGFRNPSTQDLFIGLDVGRARLIGSSPASLDNYVRDYPVSANGQALGAPSVVTLDGNSAIDNSFSVASLMAFGATGNPALLEASGLEVVKPEQVKSIEFGYRGKLSRTFLVDFSVYKNTYEDFINTQAVLSPLYGTVGDNALSVLAMVNGDYETWSVYTNSSAEIRSWGGAIGVSTKIFNGFDLSANYTKSVLDFDADLNPDFATNWNTPEHKVKGQFGHPKLFKNFGFNVAWRYNSEFYWEATFGEGEVPANHVFDAQVSLTLPKLNTVLKAGAANLGGNEYFTAFGSGLIGSQYYLSLTINNL
jgi:iron complex outermembrane receptor protein